MPEPIAEPSAPPVLRLRHIVAATIGNGLEFYDFVTYAFFAIPIGHAFFPAHSEFGSLMLSLATFGAGFVTRPIGGIVIGAYADRAGRKAAMMLSFTLMGCAIVALALIPTYATIGVAAPILAVIARMVQGFSLGGEVGPNTAYLLEAASPHRRGMAVSWQAGSQQVSSVVGALVGLGLSAVLSHAALDAYGWRIAFLLGAVTLPFGLWLRRAMPETLHAEEAGGVPASGVPTRLLILGVLLMGGGTVATYITNYMTTYARGTLHMSPGVSFAASLAPNAAGLAAGLLGGWLSDRIGRRPVMIWPSVAHLALTLPVFAWIVQSHSPVALLGGMGMLGFTAAMAYGAVYTGLCESLPKRIRGRAFAIVYAVAIAVFGGTAQPIVAWLIQSTGSAMAPGWYLTAANVVGLCAMLLMRESAPVRLRAPIRRTPVPERSLPARR
jgi:MFS family permease